MADDERSARVRAQYESYPYPERDPRDEKKRLISGSPSHLAEIRHYLHRGGLPGRDSGAARPFRALIAGGGTGDAFVMLAQQLADAGIESEVTHLDISEASQAIARARAEARGLVNVRYARGEIEKVRDVAPGPYDYIDCCGVLHHLADPGVGLRALAEELAPDGGMGLMVYGTLGRTGVYHTQETMRLLADSEPDRERLSLVKRLVAGLPASNWLKRNPFVGDHIQGGEAGLYDLLLHRRDRAYTVPELLDLLAEGGMRAVAMIAPAQYDPATYLHDPALLKRARSLGREERWALAELLSGALTKHIVYAVAAGREAETVANVDDLAVVPVFRDMVADEVARGIKAGGQLSADLAGTPYRAPLPPLAPAIARLCDGRNSLADILAALRAGPRADLSEEDFRRQFAQLFTAFHAINRMLLSRP